MGAPPNEDQMADMLSDPATAQMLNEALNNPQMIDLMIQSNPTLRQMGPQAREVLQSPMFRQMMTNPDMLRQAAAMRRMMGGGAGEGAFPAPGVTDTTPQGATGTTGTPNQTNTTPVNPFGMFGALPGVGEGRLFYPNAAAGNPFQALFNPQAGTPGHTPTQSPPPPSSAGPGTPAPQRDASQPPPNPFASLFAPPGATGASPFGNMTPEMMQQAMALLQGGGLGDMGGLGGLGGTPPPPVDNRPPEELYADQLRQLNDMGFFDFERNVQALRRSGGSVQGAINQLLG
jgi:ubiquilin